MPLLTFASWNMNQNPAAWAHLAQLRDEHGVQVALVQEAKPPPQPELFPLVTPDPLDASLWRITIPQGVARRSYA